MSTTILATLLLLFGQAVPGAMPRNNPNGTWESPSGSRFDLRLSGENLNVKIVPGSNPKYLQYEVALQHDKDEINTYKGTGYFLAKLSNGKECRYETEWLVIVIGENRITGGATEIIPDPATCGVKEKEQVRLNLIKK